MPTYNVTPRPDGTGFDIEVESLNGARQTMMGFPSEAEAEKWIAADKLRDSHATRPEA
jgi:hypothetical protein